MKKSEIILWRILAITGLNFFNYKLGHISNYFRILFLVSFPFSLSYYLATTLYNVRKDNYKEVIAAFLIPAYSGLLWCFAYSRKQAISNVVLEVYRFRIYDTESSKKIHCTMISLIIIIPALYFFMFIFNQIMTDFDTYDTKIFTFGFKIQNKILKRFLSFYLHIADIFFVSGFIFYLTMCMCVLFHRCSEILSKYKKLIRIHLQKEITNDSKDFFFKVFLYCESFAKNESKFFPSYFFNYSLLFKSHFSHSFVNILG